MKYTVIIEETLRKEVAIEAQDAEEATLIAKTLYNNSEWFWTQYIGHLYGPIALDFDSPNGSCSA